MKEKDDTYRLAARLRSLAGHIKRGTVQDRLRREIRTRRENADKWLRKRSKAGKLRHWEALKRDGGPVEVTVQGGARLRLYTDNQLAKLIYLGVFESAEQAFLWRYLRPRDVVVDVGANIGLFTVIAARKVGTAGRVYAFEPVGLPRQRLEENIALNRLGNVEVIPHGLSDEPDTIEVSVPSDGYDAWSSFTRPKVAGKVREIKKERVRVLTWDEFSSQSSIPRPAFMKIDVEGWEYRVLRGARHTLENPEAPLLQVEFTDDTATAASGSCERLYRQLSGMGFTLCRYDPGANRLLPEDLRPEYRSTNLYATKDIDAANRRLASHGH